MGKLWMLLLVPALSWAQSAATNAPAPARIVEIKVPVNNAAAIESEKIGLGGVTTLRAVLALPAGFDARRSWPVLLVTASSGSSAVQMLGAYTNTALAAGWVVAAVDGPRVQVEQDNNVFAAAMISSLLEFLRRSWPDSQRWPFACAGFSGGAKRAAMTAAHMMHQRDVVIGVFMGGCNEDRATAGYNVSRPGNAFLDLPMFLSNGTRDPIAGVDKGAVVKQAMEQSGFRKIRLESYDGGHRLDTNQLRQALEWFRPTPKPAGLITIPSPAGRNGG
jgi:predicted esterase